MNKYLIEFIGTFFLVSIIGLSGDPLAVGLGLAVLVYMGSHISGAHYNPVVSIAMFLNKKINSKELGFYTLSQCIASIFATIFINEIGNSDFSIVSQTSSIQQFFVAEIIFTFLLVFVILNVTTKSNQYYGLAIGLTLTAGAFSVGDISGAVFNPAVSFGPSFLNLINPDVLNNNIGSEEFFVYYLISSVIGSIIATFTYKQLNNTCILTRNKLKN